MIPHTNVLMSCDPRNFITYRRHALWFVGRSESVDIFLNNLLCDMVEVAPHHDDTIAIIVLLTCLASGLRNRVL